jgi:hypothetical protein
MNQEQIQRVLDLFDQREYELKVEQRAFEIWLGVLVGSYLAAAYL